MPRRSRSSVRLLFDRDGLDALLASPAGLETAARSCLHTTLSITL